MSASPARAGADRYPDISSSLLKSSAPLHHSRVYSIPRPQFFLLFVTASSHLSPLCSCCASVLFAPWAQSSARAGADRYPDGVVPRNPPDGGTHSRRRLHVDSVDSERYSSSGGFGAKVVCIALTEAQRVFELYFRSVLVTKRSLRVRLVLLSTHLRCRNRGIGARVAGGATRAEDSGVRGGRW